MIFMKFTASVNERQIVSASKGGGLNKCIQRQIITIRYYMHASLLIKGRTYSGMGK